MLQVTPHIVGLVSGVPGHELCLITLGHNTLHVGAAPLRCSRQNVPTTSRMVKVSKLIHLKPVREIRTCSLELLGLVHTAGNSLTRQQEVPGCPHSIRDISLVEFTCKFFFFSHCNHTRSLCNWACQCLNPKAVTLSRWRQH